MYGIYLLLFILFLLAFCYLFDKVSDRYKRMSDKNVNDGIGTVKDDLLKHNHNHNPYGNKTNHWF
ncbi:hypothetical protein [Sutcliffiella rhizosphaerae]|uniref:ATP synthase F0 subunit 8 n=1 Tax=Sutcliffiella rhizosphaerae TaxID=2880967 RepID=A0ABM8YMX5_9BACI|nr:hypothetical protein [Sutcliffiella rhizosphaerae]CAG9621320.1 hypothetical protein BACCIP111883_02092 [Sutcliffiella rhizosphaerae]